MPNQRLDIHHHAQQETAGLGYHGEQVMRHQRRRLFESSLGFRGSETTYQRARKPQRYSRTRPTCPAVTRRFEFWGVDDGSGTAGIASVTVGFQESWSSDPRRTARSARAARLVQFVVRRLDSPGGGAIAQAGGLDSTGRVGQHGQGSDSTGRVQQHGQGLATRAGLAARAREWTCAGAIIIVGCLSRFYRHKTVLHSSSDRCAADKRNPNPSTP